MRRTFLYPDREEPPRLKPLHLVSYLYWIRICILIRSTGDMYDHQSLRNLSLKQGKLWLHDLFKVITLEWLSDAGLLTPNAVLSTISQLGGPFSEEEEEQQEEEKDQPGDKEESSCQESQEEHVGNDTKAVIKDLDEKIAKYQKFLNKAKAKKFSAVRISKGLTPTKRGKKRKAQREEDHSNKTPARQQQSKKVGVHYYETHSVKNRNRNKKKTNDSDGQKHKHKKFKHKQ
ncbi:unnamed protein product [Nyctereutes procyonoides]|uniref:(raccoon dog) hypothetical protein n=1 Tax=Nyctereutes procyonoides TaxID=34880 RepID=A0A811ZIP5_NYCPR|nr:unnamed protein product [Nyctereutes procyonoides]